MRLRSLGAALAATSALPTLPLQNGAASAAAADVLLSQGKTAIASSEENAGVSAPMAVDGNTGTRWSSAASDPQWLQVDLGSVQSLCKIDLNWEAAYGKRFTLQASADGQSWTTVKTVTDGTGGQASYDVTGTGRYVRMNGTVRATEYGYSLWVAPLLRAVGIRYDDTQRTPDRTRQRACSSAH